MTIYHIQTQSKAKQQAQERNNLEPNLDQPKPSPLAKQLILNHLKPLGNLAITKQKLNTTEIVKIETPFISQMQSLAQQQEDIRSN